MDYLIIAAQLILSLSILVVLHEFGHFIPARYFKTKVEKFYLFFDPWFSIFKRKVGETEWGIGWLPLGGYVKIAGMVDESMDKEQLAQEPQPWEFRSKPAWQRLIIMIGGVVVNLIVGFLIYGMVLFFWGQDQVTKENLKNGLAASVTVEKIGFKDGDQILKVDGEPLENSLDISRYLMLRSPKTVTVQHADGNTETLDIPEDFGYTMWQADDMQPLMPRVYSVVGDTAAGGNAAAAGILPGDSILSVNGTEVAYYDQFFDIVADSTLSSVELVFSRKGQEQTLTIEKDSLGKLGIAPAIFEGSSYQFTTKEFGFGEAFAGGFGYAYWTLHDYASQFKYVFTKKGATQVGGFGTIAKLFPPVWDWKIFWLNTALISIILAFMNILPIPALDGGHVMFLLYEIITGREAPQKVLEYAQYIGFFLLMGLLLYANGNDLYKAIFGG